MALLVSGIKFVVFRGNSLCDCLHLFSRKLSLVVEIHIRFRINGNEMNVSMRHFKTYDSYTHAFARDSLFNSFCNTLCKRVRAL